jgi:hypothetical protein
MHFEMRNAFCLLCVSYLYILYASLVRYFVCVASYLNMISANSLTG